MEINAIGSVLIDLFELEAVVGLALLAVVIGVLAHAFLDEHHRDGFRPHVGSRR
jgi:predicted benzoate:H+ symporter BenE